MKEKNFISVVTYVNNAEKTITEFLTKIDQFLQQKFESYEIILVNDLSTDKTLEKVNEVKDAIHGNLLVVNLAWRHRNELAMLAGTDIAIGDFVYEIESTVIDYPIELIYDLYTKAITGYDIVSSNSNRPVELSSKLFYSLLNKVSYLNLDLTTENLKIVSRRALNAVLNAKEKVRYRKALYKYSGFPNTNVIYETIGNEKVNNNKTFGEKLNLAFDVLVSFSNIGLRIALVLSMLFLVFSISIGAYTVYTYLTLKTVVSGWTTTMLFLSAAFSGVFLVLGLLGKYMNIMLIELQNRPHYVVKSVKRISNK